MVNRCVWDDTTPLVTLALMVKSFAAGRSATVTVRVALAGTAAESSDNWPAPVI